MSSAPHYLRFARVLASVAGVAIGSNVAGCASAVGPGTGDAETRADTSRPMTDAQPPVDTFVSQPDVVTTSDAEVCPAVSMTCPATVPPRSTCNFGGDTAEGCACIPGMSCNYADTGPGTCGTLMCSCVATGDAGLGRWTCCSPCVGPLPPPDLGLA